MEKTTTAAVAAAAAVKESKLNDNGATMSASGNRQIYQSASSNVVCNVDLLEWLWWLWWLAATLAKQNYAKITGKKNPKNDSSKAQQQQRLPWLNTKRQIERAQQRKRRGKQSNVTWPCSSYSLFFFVVFLTWFPQFLFFPLIVVVFCLSILRSF